MKPTSAKISKPERARAAPKRGVGPGTPRSRFTFHGQLYEVSIPHENIRVCPVNLGVALIEMEEVLEFVRHNVLRTRASRYTVR